MDEDLYLFSFLMTGHNYTSPFTFSLPFCRPVSPIQRPTSCLPHLSCPPLNFLQIPPNSRSRSPTPIPIRITYLLTYLLTFLSLLSASHLRIYFFIFFFHYLVLVSVIIRYLLSLLFFSYFFPPLTYTFCLFVCLFGLFLVGKIRPWLVFLQSDLIQSLNQTGD